MPASFTFGIKLYIGLQYCVVYILSANSFSAFFALGILSSKTSIIRRYTEGKLRRG